MSKFADAIKAHKDRPPPNRHRVEQAGEAPAGRPRDSSRSRQGEEERGEARRSRSSEEAPQRPPFDATWARRSDRGSAPERPPEDADPPRGESPPRAEKSCCDRDEGALLESAYKSRKPRRPAPAGRPGLTFVARARSRARAKLFLGVAFVRRTSRRARRLVQRADRCLRCIARTSAPTSATTRATVIPSMFATLGSKRFCGQIPDDVFFARTMTR